MLQYSNLKQYMCSQKKKKKTKPKRLKIKQQQSD